MFRRRFRGRSRRLWCRATSGSTGFAKDPGSLDAKPRRIQRVPNKVPEKIPRFREALVLSLLRFNRIPEKVPVRSSGRCLCRVRFNSVSEKVPKKVPGSLGAKPSQVHWVPEKVVEKVPEKVERRFWEIFGAGPGQIRQVQRGFQRLASQHPIERFVKIKRCCS